MPETIYDIKVNDDEFQKYLESVRQYHALLHESSSALQQATTLKDNDSSFEKRGKAQKRLLEVTQQLNRAYDQGNVSEQERNRLLREQERLMRQTSSTQSNMIGQARSFARSPLGKAGVARLSFLGTAKIVSSLFNRAHDIAHTGAELRTNARALGIKSGQFQSWHTTLDNYSSPGETAAVLSEARQATFDVRERSKMSAFGVDKGALDRGDVNAIGLSFLQRLHDTRKEHPGAAYAQYMQGRQLGDYTGLGANLGDLSDEEFNKKIIGGIRDNAGKLNVSDKPLGKDTDAAVQADYAKALRTKDVLSTTAGTINHMVETETAATNKLDDAAEKLLEATEKFGTTGTIIAGILGAIGPALLLTGGKKLLKPLVKKGGRKLVKRDVKETAEKTGEHFLEKEGAKTLAHAGEKEAAKGILSKLTGKFVAKQAAKFAASEAVGSSVPVAGNIAMGVLDVADMADDLVFDGGGKQWMWNKGKKAWGSLTGSASSSAGPGKQSSSVPNPQSPLPPVSQLTLPSVTEIVLPPGMRIPRLIPPLPAYNVPASQQRERAASSQPQTMPSSQDQATTQPPPPADINTLVGAMAMQESHGDPRAISKAGAQGLLQFMPATSRALGVTNPFDARQSWEAGEKYLSQLNRRYHGDLDKALAAYNWGPGNLNKDIRKRGDHWRDGLPRETRDYVAKVNQNVQTNHVIKIENYSGNDVSVSARQLS